MGKQFHRFGQQDSIWPWNQLYLYLNKCARQKEWKLSTSSWQQAELAEKPFIVWVVWWLPLLNISCIQKKNNPKPPTLHFRAAHIDPLIQAHFYTLYFLPHLKSDKAFYLVPAKLQEWKNVTFLPDMLKNSGSCPSNPPVHQLCHHLWWGERCSLLPGSL